MQGRIFPVLNYGSRKTWDVGTRNYNHRDPFYKVMKKNALITAFIVAICGTSFAQTISLTFTAQDAYGQYVQPERVVITNHTRDWQEIVYWPDTGFTMRGTTGLNDIELWNNAALQLFQNNPNPFRGATDVALSVAEEGNVTIELTDINGRIMGKSKYSLAQKGLHSFRVSVATPGIYILTARQNKKSSTIKMVCKEGGASNAIDYAGEAPAVSYILKSGTTNPFEVGDEMEYVAYTVADGAEVGSVPVTQVQTESQTVVLMFAGAVAGDSLPCLGMATVTDHEGNVYNTVRIGTQCWTRENMRCTTSPNGYLSFGCSDTSDSYNSSNYVPYYYDYTQSGIPFEDRGLLYNWAGAMDTISTNYITESFTGRRGICPAGWHVPSQAEWDTLGNYLSSHDEYQCGALGHYYIAKSLAAQNYWDTVGCSCGPGNDQSANNATGFTAVPTGSYFWITAFNYSGKGAYFWASTSRSDVLAGNIIMTYEYSTLGMGDPTKDRGYAVRCLRD